MTKPTPAQLAYRRRGPRPDSKVRVSIRLKPDVLAKAVAAGGVVRVVEGWASRRFK